MSAHSCIRCRKAVGSMWDSEQLYVGMFLCLSARPNMQGQMSSNSRLWINPVVCIRFSKSTLFFLPLKTRTSACSAWLAEILVLIVAKSKQRQLKKKLLSALPFRSMALFSISMIAKVIAVAAMKQTVFECWNRMHMIAHSINTHLKYHFCVTSNIQFLVLR